jgi:flagellar motor switch protein FliM
MQKKRQKTRIYQRHNAPDVMKLEMNKLGRPYHKVPKIFTDRFDILDARIGNYFLKKYRVNVSLSNLNFKMDCAHKHAIIFATEFGNIGFDIDRKLLLDVLNDYYGLNSDNNHSLSVDDTQPITKTEERLKNKLGCELCSLIINCDVFNKKLKVKTDYSAIINNWSYKLTFSLEGYHEGNIYLLLDNHHIDKLLSTFRVPSDEQSSEEPLSSAVLEKLINFLPLRLTGRLSSSNLTVAELSELKNGDILPISLPERFPVFIGKEQPFTAVIAEDRGKLFLSEFNEKLSETNND